MNQKKIPFCEYIMQSSIGVWSNLDTLANICNDGLDEVLILPTLHDAKLILR